jgi:hypothetical protein
VPSAPFADVLAPTAAAFDHGDRAEVAVVAGHQDRRDAEVGEVAHRQREDARRVTASTVAGSDAVTDVAALVEQVVAQFVTDRGATHQLAVDLGDEKARGDAVGVRVLAPPLPVEDGEVVGERGRAVTVEEEGEPVGSQLLVRRGGGRLVLEPQRSQAEPIDIGHGLLRRHHDVIRCSRFPAVSSTRFSHASSRTSTVELRANGRFRGSGARTRNQRRTGYAADIPAGQSRSALPLPILALRRKLAPTHKNRQTAT